MYTYYYLYRAYPWSNLGTTLPALPFEKVILNRYEAVRRDVFEYPQVKNCNKGCVFFVWYCSDIVHIAEMSTYLMLLNPHIHHSFPRRLAGEKKSDSYKGAFTNYVYKIWLFLTTYPPPFTFSMV